MTPDDVLSELKTIRARLDDLATDDPQRAALEARRRELKHAAEAAASMPRDPAILRRELEHLERRLADLDGEKINVPRWQIALSSAGRLAINDPAAHAAKLNRALDEATALDRRSIEDRIRRLRDALEE